MVTVYEISRVIVTPLCLIPLGVTIIILSLLIGCFARNRKRSTAKIAVFSALLMVSFLLSIVSLYIITENYKNIITPYYKGEYIVVEGEIENIRFYNDTCKFTVNGVELGDQGQSAVLYPGFMGNNKYIHSEGKHVKVGYISYDGYNIVVRLEIEEKDKK